LLEDSKTKKNGVEVAVSKITILQCTANPHTAASDQVRLHASVLMLHQPALLTMYPVTAVLL
jgi:hypothetical protein